MRTLFSCLILILGFQAQALMWVDECADINGASVGYQNSPNISQAGEGTILNGYPVILINPNMMRQYTPAVQQFILAHECAHQKLGHVLNHHLTRYYPETYEFDADCASVKVLKNYGFINPSSKIEIFQFLSTLSASPTHPASNRRIAYAQQCLQ